MHITSSIPNGSGRIRKLASDFFEIELIAYSKGSRYFCVEVSSCDRNTSVRMTLVPDSLFRVSTFPYKCEADVWFCNVRDRQWQRLDAIERTPERVTITLMAEKGQKYLVSSEPPHRYVDTTQELFRIAQKFADITSVHFLGASVEHRPIVALRVASSLCMPGEEDRPVVHIVAGEHASEAAGEEIARGMLAHVLERIPRGDFSDRIFDFILNANPDGNFHGWHQYNATDWTMHNYADEVDRSWHHEFAPYLLGADAVYSPETIALMEWMKLTRPACYISMHSWEGEKGNPGAFYSSPDILNKEMADAARAFVEISESVGAALGVNVRNYPCSSRDQHLSTLLMTSGIASAYLPEGNYAMGPENLRTYGAGLLERFMTDHRVISKNYDRRCWDLFCNVSVEDCITVS